jgi:hypothetical protein
VQGIFLPHECVSHASEFVADALANPGAAFVLTGPGRQELSDFGTKLQAAGLVPSALLNVTFRDPAEVSTIHADLLGAWGQ